MAASTKLVVPDIPIVLATIIYSAIIISAEILIPYAKYVRFLRYLTISLFAYVATAIIVGGNFTQIFLATIIPHIEFTLSYAMMFVAIFGTTISPYQRHNGYTNSRSSCSSDRTVSKDFSIFR